ncbi:MAG: hypothetical protein ABID63_02465 [Pseudomonadota bacterium]
MPHPRGEKPKPPFPRYVPGSHPVMPETSGGGQDGISLAQVEGRIDRRTATMAAKLVDAAPEEALRVIRTWLHQD